MAGSVRTPGRLGSRSWQPDFLFRPRWHPVLSRAPKTAPGAGRFFRHPLPCPSFMGGVTSRRWRLAGLGSWRPAHQKPTRCPPPNASPPWAGGVHDSTVIDAVNAGSPCQRSLELDCTVIDTRLPMPAASRAGWDEVHRYRHYQCGYCHVRHQLMIQCYLLRES